MPLGKKPNLAEPPAKHVSGPAFHCPAPSLLSKPSANCDQLSRKKEKGKTKDILASSLVTGLSPLFTAVV